MCVCVVCVFVYVYEYVYVYKYIHICTHTIYPRLLALKENNLVKCIYGNFPVSVFSTEQLPKSSAPPFLFLMLRHLPSAAQLIFITIQLSASCFLGCYSNYTYSQLLFLSFNMLLTEILFLCSPALPNVLTILFMEGLYALKKKESKRR